MYGVPSTLAVSNTHRTMPSVPARVEVPRFLGHIVRFKDTLPSANVLSLTNILANRHRFQVKHTFVDAIKGFASAQVLPDPIMAALRVDPNVDSIEPDIEITAYGQYIPPSLIRIGGAAAGNITNPGPFSGVHVFILDTGVQLNNPDLNVVENKSFVTTERDGNDMNGHGTMVAGVAAAKNNNSYVVGVAPGAPIHAYKVMDKTGSGSLSNIIKGLDAVIQYKRKNSALQNKVVVNMSLGGFAGTNAYNSLDTAIQTAVTTYGITVVVAAGNDSLDASLVTPAHTLEAITVGSFADSTNTFSSFSNYGPVVDILAPGESILTTGMRSTTAVASGTSFSSPAVAGAAAVYLSQNPGASPSQVAQAIVNLSVASSNSGVNAYVNNVPVNTVGTSVFVNGL